MILPSVTGSFGSVSALPVPGGALAVTYADYTAPVGTMPATAMMGGRLFANAVCY